MEKFREIDISGNAHERGLSHGEQLRDEIAEALNFYRSIFKLPETVVLEQATHFQQVIGDFNPDYLDEIIGIAEGSGQDLLWIVALNARTEILALSGTTSVNECTSLCFTKKPVLGQTWDWGKSLEKLCSIMHIHRPDGHVIRMLSEPGIIGKIGMNNAGLGVCLNILTLGERLDGVPIHVMLRAILDCKSAKEATAIINHAATGKSSNIIVADNSGSCFDIEFAGRETFSPPPVNGCFTHTNHYLGKEINGIHDPLFYNSRTRLNTAIERLSRIDDFTVQSMIDALSDRSHDQFPIFRPYVPDDALQNVGTVATIVMELSTQKFHIRKGNDLETTFTTYTV